MRTGLAVRLGRLSLFLLLRLGYLQQALNLGHSLVIGMKVEGQSQTGPMTTRRPADTMHIGCRRGWKVKINHVLDALEVNTTRDTILLVSTWLCTTLASL